LAIKGFFFALRGDYFYVGIKGSNLARALFLLFILNVKKTLNKNNNCCTYGLLIFQINLNILFIVHSENKFLFSQPFFSFIAM
jgi:hypothetical protein